MLSFNQLFIISFILSLVSFKIFLHITFYVLLLIWLYLSLCSNLEVIRAVTGNHKCADCDSPGKNKLMAVCI